jgi:arginine repressor
MLDHARALRSIGAKKVRREGKEWIWTLPQPKEGEKSAG